MKYIYLMFLGCLIGCGSQPELPEGITIKRADSGDIIVYLDHGSGLMVSDRSGEPSIMLANLDGSLNIVEYSGCHKSIERHDGVVR
jgi:hypothetical protein